MYRLIIVDLTGKYVTIRKEIMKEFCHFNSLSVIVAENEIDQSCSKIQDICNKYGEQCKILIMPESEIIKSGLICSNGVVKQCSDLNKVNFVNL